MEDGSSWAGSWGRDKELGKAPEFLRWASHKLDRERQENSDGCIGDVTKGILTILIILPGMQNSKA